jgi:predicted nucleotidyltransferase
MNKATEIFLEDLKKRPDVVGVILFGSWARGNNRPESDVDLVVILQEGYQRAVETHNGQLFEIIYTTAQSAFDFWESHKDEAAGLWSVAKILFDRDGTVGRLKADVQCFLQEGKKEINALQLEQLRFDANDLIRYARSISTEDPTTSYFILTNKVFTLTETFFDVRQKWTPPPKQRLAVICDVSPDLYALLCAFYQDAGLPEKIDITQRMLPLVFPNK